ncbi:zinc finger, RING/FYVE/PHD-type, Alfin [Artemisia annua]|uniref:PHD finger protein ALFIN-LIKE n=1 Tax=Artemisia annua TaxID=35608 RepID=A0A2U1KDG1_ARTAN|nr:zinc finger, RING/FYVE/PHD-type, Alfin [Artemisia annua]
MEANYNPRTVEEVFRDFKGRRAGIIKALTTDVAEFYQQCDPEKENLCLYGFPSEQWEVNLPAEEVPPELPEPALGINFARDGMQEKDWLSLVAVHSDAWLLSVSFYFGARFGFGKSDRQLLVMFAKSDGMESTTPKGNVIPANLLILIPWQRGVFNSPFSQIHHGMDEKVNHITQLKRLFNMINDLPTVFEVVNGTAQANQKEKSTVSNHSSTKSKSNSKKWFHGKCVNITPARAEKIKQYKCPSCSNKRARP